MDSLLSVMEYLYQHRAPNLPPVALANVFEILFWGLKDEGKEALDVHHRWLLSTDRGKVEIALAVKEVFPSSTRSELVKLLSDISGKWPDLDSVCGTILKGWDEQLGNRSLIVEGPGEGFANGTFSPKDTTQ